MAQNILTEWLVVLHLLAGNPLKIRNWCQPILNDV